MEFQRAIADAIDARTETPRVDPAAPPATLAEAAPSGRART